MGDLQLEIDGRAFELPEDADPEQLRQDLADALEQGTVLTVPVVMDESEGPVDLLVNGKVVRVAVVYRSKPATTLGF